MNRASEINLLWQGGELETISQQNILQDFSPKFFYQRRVANDCLFCTKLTNNWRCIILTFTKFLTSLQKTKFYPRHVIENLAYSRASSACLRPHVHQYFNARAKSKILPPIFMSPKRTLKHKLIAYAQQCAQIFSSMKLDSYISFVRGVPYRKKDGEESNCYYDSISHFKFYEKLCRNLVAQNYFGKIEFKSFYKQKRIYTSAGKLLERFRFDRNFESVSE